MAKFKVDLKTRRIASEKEKISKVARVLLIAFCVQFIFYLFLVNVIPYTKITEDETIVNNAFFMENWYNYKGSGVNLHLEGNGIKFIYWYNMILLIANLFLCMHYMINVFSEEYKRFSWPTIKNFFKKNKGLLFLFIFMTLSFISSLFAYDKFRSFIGCYNLRDGYFSFMFYGSMLTNMLFLGLSDFENTSGNKKKIDSRKLIISLFLISMTTISAIMVINYHVLNASDIYSLESGIRNEPITYKDSVTSATFNNSNHFAYALSISVIAAACMFIKEKSFWRFLYLGSFVLMLYTLIINNTFGAYIGVAVSIVCMIICAMITRKEILPLIGVIVIFAVMSSFTIDENGEKILVNNIQYISDSISVILNSNKSVNNTSDNDLIYSEEIPENNVINNVTDNVTNDSGITDAGEAGSGRWKLWVVGTEIALENPILGVGLENMLYVYNEKGIAEGRSHNLIIQLAGTVGIPAMILYVLAMGWIFIRGLRTIKNWDMYMYTGMMVMVSYLISSLTGNSAFYTSGYFYIFVGLVVLYLFKQRKETENKK